MRQKLFEDFKKIDKAQWQEKATADLKGVDPHEKYNWEIEKNVALNLYYDSSDIQNIPTEFQNRQLVTDHPSGAIRHWDNLQAIDVDDEKSANKKALEALEGGAEGLIFKLSKDSVDLESLLNGVEAKYCSIWFQLNNSALLESTTSYLNKLNPQTGGLIISEIVDFKNISGNLSEKSDLKIALSLTDGDTSFSEKISSLLAMSTQAIANDSLLLKKLAVYYPLGTDFFGEIAAIRALRQLYFQLVRAYQIEDFQPEDLHIIGVSTIWNNEDYNPHANMLKSTTAGMAAVLGGCSSLLVEPENEDKPYMARVARNVSNILKEESYFNSNADPVAGSYYLEALTDTLAKKAWSLFQQKLNK